MFTHFRTSVDIHFENHHAFINDGKPTTFQQIPQASNFDVFYLPHFLFDLIVFISLITHLNNVPWTLYEKYDAAKSNDSIDEI